MTTYNWYYLQLYYLQLYYLQLVLHQVTTSMTVLLTIAAQTLAWNQYRSCSSPSGGSGGVEAYLQNAERR